MGTYVITYAVEGKPAIALEIDGLDNDDSTPVVFRQTCRLCGYVLSSVTIPAPAAVGDETFLQALAKRAGIEQSSETVEHLNKVHGFSERVDASHRG